MTAGEMPGFVRQHPDDLVGGLGLHHRAVVHEDAAAIGDKGVESTLVENDDLDVLLFEAGSAQDRPGVFAQQLLGLGVADHPRALFLLCKRRGDWRQCKRRRSGEGGQCRGFF